MSPILFLNHGGMIKPEFIRSILNEALQNRNLFLVDVVVTPAGKITVYIDGMDGVTVNDCAEISRFIESRIDRNLQDYELEVSSPGEERSLLIPEQYRKNTGRKMEILRTDGIRLQGKLKDFSENRVFVETEQLVKDEKSGKKKKTIEIVKIELDQIKKAMIIVSK